MPLVKDCWHVALKNDCKEAVVYCWPEQEVKLENGSIKKRPTHEFHLEGDNLKVNQQRNIFVSLRLMSGKMEVKKEVMQPVPFHFPSFIDKAKKILEIPETTQLQFFMEIGKDEIEINHVNLDRLKDQQTVIIRRDERFLVELFQLILCVKHISKQVTTEEFPLLFKPPSMKEIFRLILSFMRK